MPVLLTDSRSVLLRTILALGLVAFAAGVASQIAAAEAAASSSRRASPSALRQSSGAPAPQAPSTVWDGVFTEAQALRGQEVYKEACGRCHQDDLLGERDIPPLVGQVFTNRWTGSSVDDMLQTIRRTMPQEAPDSLGTQAYVDLIGYLLKANGGAAGASELPTDTTKLQQILVTGRPN